MVLDASTVKVLPQAVIPKISKYDSKFQLFKIQYKLI